MSEKEIPKSLISFINKHQSILVVGHSDPDGDCIGSGISLRLFLERIGKEVHIFTEGPFDRNEVLNFSKQFLNKILPSHTRQNPGVIIVDCSTIDRIGSLATSIKGLEIAVIDHHSEGKKFGDIRFIDTYAPSVTYMILRIIEKMGYEPTLEEAKYIMFGLCTDTGYFRFLREGSGHIFSAVARLVETGVSPAEIHDMIYGNQSIESRKLIALLLERTESYFKNQLLVSWFTQMDRERFGDKSRDTDTLYQLYFNVKECKAVIFLKEEALDTCSVSLRSSNNSVNVGKIASLFGGGGHTKASGFHTEESYLVVKDKLLEVFTEVFSESSQSL